MKILRPEEVTGPILMDALTPEQLTEAYRLAREAFTAADLQKYTELLDEEISMDEVLRELEAEQERSDAKRKQS